MAMVGPEGVLGRAVALRKIYLLLLLDRWSSTSSLVESLKTLRNDFGSAVRTGRKILDPVGVTGGRRVAVRVCVLGLPVPSIMID
jgi:hypothetical protein